MPHTSTLFGTPKKATMATHERKYNQEDELHADEKPRQLPSCLRCRLWALLRASPAEHGQLERRR
jgi:hypothetical protein